jgi:hypothetical protein
MFESDIARLAHYDRQVSEQDWLNVADGLIHRLGIRFECLCTRGFYAVDEDENRYFNCRVRLEPFGENAATKLSFEGVLYIGNGPEPNRQRDQSLALVILFPFLCGIRLSPLLVRDYYLESILEVSGMDYEWRQPIWSLDECMEWHAIEKPGDLFRP